MEHQKGNKKLPKKSENVQEMEEKEVKGEKISYKILIQFKYKSLKKNSSISWHQPCKLKL